MSAHSGGKRAKAAPRNKIWVAILALLTVLLLWSALRAEAVPAGQGIVPQAAYLNTSGPLYHYTDPTGDVIARTGVDVSSYQGDIDWNAVREAGAEFAIVRVGFRGYGTGAIVEDSRFLQNVPGHTSLKHFRKAIDRGTGRAQCSVILHSRHFPSPASGRSFLFIIESHYTEPPRFCKKIREAASNLTWILHSLSFSFYMAPLH